MKKLLSILMALSLCTGPVMHQTNAQGAVSQFEQSSGVESKTGVWEKLKNGARKLGNAVLENKKIEENKEVIAGVATLVAVGGLCTVNGITLRDAFPRIWNAGLPITKKLSLTLKVLLFRSRIKDADFTMLENQHKHNEYERVIEKSAKVIEAETATINDIANRMSKLEGYKAKCEENKSKAIEKQYNACLSEEELPKDGFTVNAECSNIKVAYKPIALEQLKSKYETLNANVASAPNGVDTDSFKTTLSDAKTIIDNSTSTVEGIKAAITKVEKAITDLAEAVTKKLQEDCKCGMISQTSEGNCTGACTTELTKDICKCEDPNATKGSDCTKFCETQGNK